MAGVNYTELAAEVERVSQAQALRSEADIPNYFPKWFIKLGLRMAQLEKGRAYTLTVLMLDDEPVWMLQALGKVENDRWNGKNLVQNIDAG